MKSPWKIVLDTNVVLDWFVFRNPGMATVAESIEQGAVTWIGSADTRAELAHVLVHACLPQHPFDLEHVLTSTDRLMQIELQPAGLSMARWRCSDASDQKFIDLATTHRARWLLTRDRAVLKLARKAAGSGLAIQVPEAWRLDADFQAPVANPTP